MRARSTTRWFSILPALALAAAVGCDGGKPDAPPVERRVQLASFDSCSALESHIKQIAKREMELQIDSQIESMLNASQYARGGGVGASFDGASAGNAAASPPTAGAAAPKSSGTQSSEPAAHTTTNTQVKGVDEPDFVKNDGKRIFVLSGNRLYAARSWPPEKLTLASRHEVEGRPTQMFLDADNDRIVVFSTVSTYFHDPAPATGAGATPSVPARDCAGAGCTSYSTSRSYSATKITVFDVSTLSSPKVVDQVYLPGTFADARRVGSMVRVVLRDYLRRPAGIRTYPDSGWTQTHRYNELGADGYRSAYIDELRRLKSENDDKIDNTTLDQWLLDPVRKLANGDTAEFSYDCTNIYKSNAPVQLGLASVVTLDLTKLAGKGGLQRLSVLGSVGEIYASAKSLYITNRHWWWTRRVGQYDYTYLHKFDISGKQTRYVASGGVRGHILNQFSMDEHKGYLRVATTIQTLVEDPQRPWRTLTENRVSVLREVSGRLDETGRTGDIAQGERIYSARFVGDRGFIVTYRQVDPLYTIDLAKPSAPRIVGQLKVPGFSTYIHPVDHDHLLTIGIHTPEPNSGGNWQERAVKVSLFDVSDFKHPKETFSHKLGSYRGSSEATRSHKAFNYFAEQKLLAVPYTDYAPSYSGSYWDNFISELRVLHIDPKKGITERGALSLKDLYQQRGTYSWSWRYSPNVRRSVMAVDDNGNEFVYAISDAGIRAAKLDGLTTPLATAEFPK